MKRRGIFVALVGGIVAKAQALRPDILPDGDLSVRKVKPKNGECPVCGTMHVVPPPYSAFEGSIVAGHTEPPLPRRADHTGLVTATERRCEFCSVVFWVDCGK